MSIALRRSSNLLPLDFRSKIWCSFIASRGQLKSGFCAHAQKPDFVFQRNGRVHLNRWGRQFSRLLAAEVCASAVVMLDTPCSEIVWRVLTTHSIRQFPPLHFPFRVSPCAITFQLESIMHATFLGHFILHNAITEYSANTTSYAAAHRT